MALRGLDVAVQLGTPEFYPNRAYKAHSVTVRFYLAFNPEAAIGIVIEKASAQAHTVACSLDAYG